jgi:hypothetical protein
MKHDFILNEYGEIDIWLGGDGDYHNGPKCRRCGNSWCHHCQPGIYDEECPSGQLDLPLLESAKDPS